MKHLFRKRNALALHELHYGPNMTPMVDVVMVILIFFMASAVILGPEWFLRSSLPVAKPGTAASAGETVKIQAAMLRDGQATVLDLTLDSGQKNRVPLAQFDAYLRNQLTSRGADQIIVLIMPEAEVSYDDIVRVHEMAQNVGIKQVGLYEHPTLVPSPSVDPAAAPR